MVILIESIVGTDCAENKYRRDTKSPDKNPGIWEIKSIILMEFLDISGDFNSNRPIASIHKDFKEALENSGLNNERLSIITSFAPATIGKLSKDISKKHINILIMYNEIGFTKLIKPFSHFLIDKRSEECNSKYQQINHANYERNKDNNKYNKEYLIDRIHQKINI